MTDMTQMRTWAEIDLDALAHNYHALRAMAPAGCKFLGLVKSNAYGHGAVPIAQKLERLGTDMLAVACLAEAIELRQAGVALPILCLGPTPPELMELLPCYEIIQMVEDFQTGKHLSAVAQTAGKAIKVHIKVDTGMGRLGFRWRGGEDSAPVVEEIMSLCTLPGLETQGLFTHFSDADGSRSYTMAQLERFLQIKTALAARGAHFTICHCGSSAAVLHYDCIHMDMIRPGIALYGHRPDPTGDELQGVELRPVMSVKSRVYSIRQMGAGDFVSYGRTATLEQETRLAVIPVGYGDGYPRRLSNKMDMLIRGERCPIVGRVCMDMCMVDVTHLPDLVPWEAVLVYGLELTDRAARLADTIVYELLCNLSPRIPRIYLEHGAQIG